MTMLATMLATSLVAILSAEIEVPRNQGWVTDLAGVLQPQEKQALATLMESYKSGTGHEIALLTVQDLGGKAIEPYALEVARAWGIGSKKQNNGALLVVAVQERKMRIEVGRGLEGQLPDSVCGRIIRALIAPQFKTGHFYAGLSQGVAAIHSAIGGDYGAIGGRASRSRRTPGLLGLFPLIMMMLFFGSLQRRRYRGGRRGAGGVLPWLLLGGAMGSRRSGGGGSGGGFGGGGFGGFGGGGGFSGGGASGGW